MSLSQDTPGSQTGSLVFPQGIAAYVTVRVKGESCDSDQSQKTVKVEMSQPETWLERVMHEIAKIYGQCEMVVREVTLCLTESDHQVYETPCGEQPISVLALA